MRRIPSNHEAEVLASRSMGGGSEITTRGETPPASMFASAEAMKIKVRQKLLKEEYDVRGFYKTRGFCQWVARSARFEQATLAVITLNALWFAIDSDLNSADILLEAHPAIQLGEHFFCAYFAFEWVMRFGAFERKLNGLKDWWFVFDTVMAAMMVGDTWVMTAVMLGSGAGSGGFGDASILRLLRLLRLSRMARMAKLLRSMPELLILVKGMATATKSVMYTLLLLFFLVYVYGIAFRQLLDEKPAGLRYFSSVPRSMHTLLIDGALLDNAGNVVRSLEAESAGYVLLFYTFVLLASFTVLNLLIGVLCEVVSAVADAERETITVAALVQGFKEILLGGMDSDGDNLISRTEFETILDNNDAIDLLRSVDVDPVSLVDFADFIFECENEEEEKQLTLDAFLEIVLKLRGTNIATVKDFVDIRKFLTFSIHDIEQKLDPKPDPLAAAAPTQRRSSLSLRRGGSRTPTRKGSNAGQHDAPHRDSRGSSRHSSKQLGALPLTGMSRICRVRAVLDAAAHELEALVGAPLRSSIAGIDLAAKLSSCVVQQAAAAVDSDSEVLTPRRPGSAGNDRPAATEWSKMVGVPGSTQTSCGPRMASSTGPPPEESEAEFVKLRWQLAKFKQALIVATEDIETLRARGSQ